MYRVLFDFVKRRVPRISGPNWLPCEAAIRVWTAIYCVVALHIQASRIFYIIRFRTSMLPELFRNFDGNPLYPGDGKWIDYLAKNKYFSFLIDEKYGGVKLSGE